jgi:hypothetical protein
MSDTDKFLTPASMLTPGLAGGITMGITAALAFQFALGAPTPAAPRPQKRAFFKPLIRTAQTAQATKP